MARWALAAALACVALVGRSGVEASISNTVHNLSASGPGTFKDPRVGEICVFCHTPHRAATSRALWNRDLPPVTYQLYSSSTLEATLNQPTGTSRLCLSCHDGTTALGALRVPPAGGAASIGPLTGRAALGTDLSDDHPVSFTYDTTLALRDGQLAEPSGLPAAIRLDAAGQVQCSSCHDPHSDRYRKFLRVDDRAGGLCLNCHRQRNWSGSTHATAPATWNGAGGNPWPTTPYTTVADNACFNCHRPHSAPRPPRLHTNAEERAVCLVCHSGNVASKSIEAELFKPSAHPIGTTNWIHDPREDFAVMARHVTCADCHNPHQVTPTPGVPPGVPGRLRGVRGLSVSGTPVAEAVYLYEVCLKCHGLQDQTTPGAVRVDNIRNIRLKINPGNPSYHPVAATGTFAAIADLNPPYTASSIIYCTDCHNSEQTGPTSPRGPHGSQYAPILEREFQQGDPVAESPSAFALCYKCHSRSVLLGGGSIRFPHDKHLQGANASCAVCHDVHGSRQNIRLINFMLRSKDGAAVVRPSRSGRLEFRPDPSNPGRGECYLSCHGQEHDPRNY